MELRIDKKNAIGVFSICSFFAIVGTLLAGDGLEQWYPNLTKPWYSLPLWGWYIVGIFYYLILGGVLYRLLNRSGKPMNKVLITGILVILAYNEIWNFFFLGLQSTFAAFWGMLPFTLLAVAFYILLRKYDKRSALIFTPYLLWLIYDLIWTYQLWKLNG